MARHAVNVAVDTARAFQRIDGFGVNINPNGHWRDGTLAATLDTLRFDLGARIFRLDPYGTSDWVGGEGAEALDPAGDERVYTSPDFRDAWEVTRYLEERGATILLNVSGPVPRWMCGPDGVTLVDTKSYVEMLASLVRWSVEEEHLAVPYVGPLNETDIGPPEGPFAGPDTACAVLEQLRARLAQGGLDRKLAGFDQAHLDRRYIDRLLARPDGSRLLDVVAMHSYRDDVAYDEVTRVLPALDEPAYWLTEYGDLDNTGELELEVAIASTRRLIQALRGGVNAALVWDAYDNWHRHENGWTLYGLLRTAVRGPVYHYTKKKRYYAARQVYRYILPAWRRVACNDDGTVSTVACAGEDGELTVVGLNERQEERAVRLEVSGPTPVRDALSVVATSPELSCDTLYDSGFSGTALFTVPGRSVFTATTLPVDRSLARV
jgi:hypothetical protein